MVSFGKEIGRVVGFVFLLVILIENVSSLVILLVTDRKMIARKQVLVVLLGLNSIDRNKKRQNTEGKVGREI